MAQLLVIVELLNKRNAVPATFADRSGIIGVVKKGFQFEGTACTDTQNAAPGKWYRDRDGYFYWGGGLTEVTERLRIPYDEQKMGWHFRGPDGIDVLNLWNNHGLYGQNVRVAVIDSGISTSITDIMNAVKDRNLDMKSFVAGEGIEDDTGHGTQCASIIASRGMQLYGAAPQCELIVAKVRSLQKAQNSQVVLAALQWACDERNADIVSMSFNGKKEDKPIADFIADHFTNMNKLFIASVGNIGALGKDLPAYPANYEGCISIGAYGHGRMHWIDSAWNSKLTFISPGVELKGYQLSGVTDILPSATSYACPFSAGVLACILSHYKKSGKTFNAADFVQRIITDAVPEDAPLKYGRGIIHPEETIKNL